MSSKKTGPAMAGPAGVGATALVQSLVRAAAIMTISLQENWTSVLGVWLLQERELALQYV